MVARSITIVQMLPELESGGIERGTLEMGAFLAQKGHRSIVISSDGRLVPQLVQEGSVHFNWRVGQKSPWSLRYLLPLRRLLQQERVDILHLRSRVPAWLGYVVWKSLPSLNRPKLITTFHGFYSINRYSAIMARGEKVIAISRIIAEHIRKHYKVAEDRIVTIHRGFDEKVFDPEQVAVDRIERLRRSWGISGQTAPVILLPGRITRLKGHDLFLKSLASLSQMDWIGVIAGDLQENPAYAAELYKMITDFSLDGKIRMAGHCDDMPAAYLAADLIVSATSLRPEAFGRTAVEAQAMGRPVIASAHGGSLETILAGKTGWLVKPNDTESLSNAIFEAISDASLRQKLGTSGRKWVREHFTLKKMCEKTLTVYTDLLEKRKSTES